VLAKFQNKKNNRTDNKKLEKMIKNIKGFGGEMQEAKSELLNFIND
jgi:hypothetical protein